MLLKHGSTKLRARLRPEENPRPVDPRVQAGVHYVRKGSHAAVKVSGFLGKVLWLKSHVQKNKCLQYDLKQQ